MCDERRRNKMSISNALLCWRRHTPKNANGILEMRLCAEESLDFASKSIECVQDKQFTVPDWTFKMCKGARDLALSARYGHSSDIGSGKWLHRHHRQHRRHQHLLLVSLDWWRIRSVSRGKVNEKKCRVLRVWLKVLSGSTQLVVDNTGNSRNRSVALAHTRISIIISCVNALCSEVVSRPIHTYSLRSVTGGIGARAIRFRRQLSPNRIQKLYEISINPLCDKNRKVFLHLSASGYSGSQFVCHRIDANTMHKFVRCESRYSRIARALTTNIDWHPIDMLMHSCLPSINWNKPCESMSRNNNFFLFVFHLIFGVDMRLTHESIRRNPTDDGKRKYVAHLFLCSIASLSS